MTDMTIQTGPMPDLGLRRVGVMGTIATLILFLVLGGWAATFTIGGAVMAGGQSVVHGKPKLVQSLEGGTVSDIIVRTGDTVAAGDLLVRLDPTVVQTNLDIARTRIAAALALRARLQAEQDGQDILSFNYPALPFDRPDTAAHEISQREIFAARAAVLQGGRDQLAETLLQYDSQTIGAQGQIAAIQDQLDLLDSDIVNKSDLAGKGLVRQSELSDLQRARAALTGQMAAEQAELARLSNARRDSTLKTLQTERAFIEDVVTQLRETNDQIDELTLDIVTRTAQLAQMDIRAPAAGIVHEMQVNTTGGVIAPGGTIAQIIPLDDGMDFELQVDPRAIDQVYPGQTARLSLSSFDPQVTPKLIARVVTVSPGTIADPQTGRSFYRVALSVSPEELARLPGMTVVPGMPIEAHLETGERSVLSYLMHPILSHLDRAFRE
ncbi:HlyD family type I secretion periplasmic adaptor subunit [Loktanella sp. M215]|uniref:HlyD family type I secretion periplasmic adaptor subunit n=1 Tax=Loktanella sp. M215 TaxID=2675431 RepID=UPI001F000965|nr:HlyD family type I secretion periplasmic adaptor subunit [Loktanella sp. M215]MCF7702211.1 HlyD family type I secretion periplasmic adaptor subunit [Loktanella sp. M215]